MRALLQRTRDLESIMSNMEVEEKDFRFGHIKEMYGNEKEISIEKGGKVIKSNNKCSMALVTCKEGFKKGSISYFQIKRVVGNYFSLCLGIVEKYNTDAFTFSDIPKGAYLSHIYYQNGCITLFRARVESMKKYFKERVASGRLEKAFKVHNSRG